MRIVFMGTPDFAVHVLDALLDAGHEVVATYTQPPRPAGRRGRALTPSPVAMRAQGCGIEVRTPTSLRNAEEQARFAALGADVAVVAAYGLLLPQPILDTPRLGCLNVHGSLLPRWRGAAPVQRAIMAGDAKTGACVMQMEAGLDTGPVRLCGSLPIGEATADELTMAVAKLGAALMVRVLGQPDAFPPVPQDEAGTTYAAKIDKAEAHLDFIAPAATIARKVQALTPYPGAYFLLDGERIKVHRATALPAIGAPLPGTIANLDRHGLAIACGDGWLLPTTVQPAGKGRLTAAEFLHGAREAVGRVAR